MKTISQQGLDSWSPKNVGPFEPAWLNRLIEEGLSKSQAEKAVLLVKQAIQNTINDPRGRWILKPRPMAFSEYPISYVRPKSLDIQSVILDRVFIEAETSTLWIIDFKTSQPHQKLETLELFLASEKAKYQSILEDYAYAVQSLFDSKNSRRLGLYFPLIPAWIEWEDRCITYSP